MTVQRELDTMAEFALSVAREAAAIVMRVYTTDFSVDYKGVNDPVTVADRTANAHIIERLSSAYPSIPIVAEESDPASYAQFRQSDRTWFVDPLDGTRDFVAKNGEFSILIGLALDGKPALGVIVCPALGRDFVAASEAFEINQDGDRRRLEISAPASLGDAIVLVSRSRRSQSNEAKLHAAGIRNIQPRGSAGVKAALVASGDAHAYVHPGVAGQRWDTCASEAVVRAAGGMTTDARGHAIDYLAASLVNDGGFVAAHPSIHAALVRAMTS